jgi:hypothetical protein
MFCLQLKSHLALAVPHFSHSKNSPLNQKSSQSKVKYNFIAQMKKENVQIDKLFDP